MVSRNHVKLTGQLEYACQLDDPDIELGIRYLSSYKATV